MPTSNGSTATECPTAVEAEIETELELKTKIDVETVEHTASADLSPYEIVVPVKPVNHPIAEKDADSNSIHDSAYDSASQIGSNDSDWDSISLSQFSDEDTEVEDEGDTN